MSMGPVGEEAPVCNDPICVRHQTHVMERYGIRYGILELTAGQQAWLAGLESQVPRPLSDMKPE